MIEAQVAHAPRTVLEFNSQRISGGERLENTGQTGITEQAERARTGKGAIWRLLDSLWGAFVRLRRLSAPCFKQCSRRPKKSNAITDLKSGDTSFMPVFNGIETPADGRAIRVEAGRLIVPDNPVIPFIEGDGTGRDIWKASQRVFDAAVGKA